MRLVNYSQVCTNGPLVVECIMQNGGENLDKTLFFQAEHNLVLPGGRDIKPDDPLGVIPSLYNPAERYHVRVVGKPWYAKADIVLEYNVPNIVNLQTSGLFPEAILRKIVYAPSLPWPYETGQRRELAMISNVHLDGEPRRDELMLKVKALCPEYQNVQGGFEFETVRKLYANTQILLNFHRTWHHHSIEEFRILPALSQGCVVISEDVPLRTSIPYHEHVIWCSYEDFPKVAAEVRSNYAAHYQRIHGGERLSKLLSAMTDEFRRSFRRLLIGQQ